MRRLRRQKLAKNLISTLNWENSKIELKICHKAQSTQWGGRSNPPIGPPKKFTFRA